MPVRAAHPLAEQQTLLVANALAQAQALLAGKPLAVVRAELAATGMDRARSTCRRRTASVPATGRRPRSLSRNSTRAGWASCWRSTSTATFVEGVLVGINSFDQWGVELGKALAVPFTPRCAKAPPR